MTVKLHQVACHAQYTGLVKHLGAVNAVWFHTADRQEGCTTVIVLFEVGNKVFYVVFVLGDDVLQTSAECGFDGDLQFRFYLKQVCHNTTDVLVQFRVALGVLHQVLHGVGVAFVVVGKFLQHLDSAVFAAECLLRTVEFLVLLELAVLKVLDLLAKVGGGFYKFVTLLAQTVVPGKQLSLVAFRLGKFVGEFLFLDGNLSQTVVQGCRFRFKRHKAVVCVGDSRCDFVQFGASRFRFVGDRFHASADVCVLQVCRSRFLVQCYALDFATFVCFRKVGVCPLQFFDGFRRFGNLLFGDFDFTLETVDTSLHRVALTARFTDFFGKLYLTLAKSRQIAFDVVTFVRYGVKSVVDVGKLRFSEE